jgi:hypothetical protein
MTRSTPWQDSETRRLRALHGRGYSLCEVARRMGRQKSTVSLHAKKLGLGWNRERTQAATSAKQADNRARRAELLEWLTERALVTTRRLDCEPFVTCTRTPNGTITNTLEYVPADDEITLIKAIAAEVAAIERIARIDGDRSCDEDRSVLARLRERLSEARESLSGET